MCDPAVNADVVKVAVLPVRFTVPIFVVPSKKVTVPVGVPIDAFTVAVKVTLCPSIEGFNDDVTVVVVVTGGGAFTI